MSLYNSITSRGQTNVYQSNRLGIRSPAGARYACNCQSQISPGPGSGSFSHFPGTFFAHCAIPFQRCFAYSQILHFSLIAVNHIAAVQKGRAAGNIRKKMTDQPACARFCQGQGNTLVNQLLRQYLLQALIIRPEQIVFGPGSDYSLHRSHHCKAFFPAAGLHGHPDPYNSSGSVKSQSWVGLLTEEVSQHLSQTRFTDTHKMEIPGDQNPPQTLPGKE